MALTPITITWNTINPDGSAPSGGILFEPQLDGVAVSLTDEGTGETVLPETVAASVNNGQLLANPVGGGPYEPFVLVANDDATTEPEGSYYLVTEKLSSGSLDPWQLIVPHDAPGATIDLSSYRPQPTP